MVFLQECLYQATRAILTDNFAADEAGIGLLPDDQLRLGDIFLPGVPTHDFLFSFD